MKLPEWGSCCFDENYRHVAIWGGRGGAKSRTVSAALVLRAAEKPLRVLCARETQRSIRDSVKRLLDDQIDRAGLGGFYYSTDTEIRGRNGSLFIFAGLRHNAESLKSIEGIDIAWIEEAHVVSSESMDFLIPTIRKPNSQIIWTWNPRHETDTVDRYFRGSQLPPRTKVIEVHHDSNPWFPDVLRQEMEYDRKRDPEKYMHVWRGEYLRHSEARVFRNWTIEEFDTPADAIHLFGGDWGFASDPVALVRCHILGRKLFVDYEAYMVGCEIPYLKDLFLTIPESEKWPITADSSRPELVKEMRRQGFRIFSAIKGAGSVMDGVEWLKSYDVIVHPRCRHTIDELSLYSYKTDPNTGMVLPILEDKHNHCIDSLRYAVEGKRRCKQKPGDIEINNGPMENYW